MRKYFLMVPGYYAFGETPAQCWANLRRISGRTKQQAQLNTYFMLEFPKDTEIEVNEIGGWWASVKPLRVVEGNFTKDNAMKVRLEKKCREGMKEHNKRVDLEAAKYRDASRGS